MSTMNARIATSTNARLLVSTINVFLVLGSTMNSQLVLFTMNACLMLSTIECMSSAAHQECTSSAAYYECKSPSVAFALT